MALSDYVLLLYTYSKMSPFFCLIMVCKKKNLFLKYTSHHNRYLYATKQLKLLESDTVRYSEPLTALRELIKTHRIWGKRENLKTLNTGFKSVMKNVSCLSTYMM